MKLLSKKEWGFLLIASVILMVVVNIPYLYGYFHTPPDRIYAGLHSQTPGDFPVYYSYIHQAREGRIFFHDLFTAEAQSHGSFNWFWVILGLLAKVLHLSAPLMFHLFRLVLIPALIFVNYAFFAWFFKDVNGRMTAFSLSFGAGVGGLFIFLLPKAVYTAHGAGYLLPVDLWVANGFVFSLLGQSPHSMLSWILQVLILLTSFLALTHNRFSYSFLAGIFSMLLFNFHPYLLPLIFSIIFCYALYLVFTKVKTLLNVASHLAVIFGLSGFALLYFFLALKNDFTFAVRLAQNITRLPPFLYIMAGYIYFFVLFAIWAAMFRKTAINKKTVFVLLWALLAIVFIFIPSQIQMRFLQGIVIPLSIFGAMAVRIIFQRIKRILPRIFVGVCLSALLLLTPITNMAIDLSFIKNNPNMFSISKDSYSAMKWVEQNTPLESVFLAIPDTGMFLAAFALRKVYVGHGHETLLSAHKQQQALAFFSSTDIEFQKAFAAMNHIDYIFSEGSRLQNDASFQLVYEGEGVFVYEVL